MTLTEGIATYVAFKRSLGMHFRSEAAQLRAALASAFGTAGPTLVEVLVA